MLRYIFPRLYLSSLLRTSLQFSKFTVYFTENFATLTVAQAESLSFHFMVLFGMQAYVP